MFLNFIFPPGTHRIFSAWQFVASALFVYMSAIEKNKQTTKKVVLENSLGNLFHENFEEYIIGIINAPINYY